MLKKFIRKTLSLFIAVMLMAVLFSSTAQAGKGGGGGKPSGKNTAPVISLASTIPVLTEDTATTAAVTLNAVDKEGNPFTWSILSTSFGTAVLEGTVNPVGAGSINVNYTAPADKNGTAAVTVQAADSLGKASSYTISITIQPVNDMPQCITLPGISGTIAAGQTVTAVEGVWRDIETPAASLTYTYQWQLADAVDGTNIINLAAVKSYTIGSGYSGKYIRIGVRAKDTGDGSSPSLTTNYAYSQWALIEQQQVQEAQYYVALGDSIAAGTNNTNLIGNSYRYTNTFSDSLKALFTGTSYTYVNDSTPGDTTADLLSKLQTNSAIRSDVSQATIITISIGGNNVLSSASPEGYSKINDTAALGGVNQFAADLPAIVNQINSLHVQGHLPQIYIMDLYNLYHPWERGWVVYSDGHAEEVFMHQAIYEKYLTKMQAAIDDVSFQNNNVYSVKTYDAFESCGGRFTITNPGYLDCNPAFISGNNPDGCFFYSPYIEGTAVYTDSLTRFDVYPFIPILFDYLNLDHYRDPHPDEAGHNVLSEAHLAKFKTVNNMN